jgi:hypothetical protein
MNAPRRRGPAAHRVLLAGSLTVGLALSAIGVAATGAPSTVAAAPERPVAPNPFLAQVPDPSKVDYAAWRARMARDAAQRAASPAYARARQAASSRLAARRGTVTRAEREPAGTAGGNDATGSAERISAFGTRKGRAHVVRILGTTTDLGAGGTTTTRPPSVEDDGSIPQATDTGLRGPGTITTTGTLGDGPHGPVASGGDGSNDFDVYAVDVPAGHQLVADTTGSDPATAAGVAVYAADGTALASTSAEGAPMTSSRLTVTPPSAGRYYVLVAGATDEATSPLPEDPFASGSGAGGATTGPYALSIGVRPTDRDHYAVRLRPGDVLGAVVTGSADTIRVTGPDGTQRIGTTGLDLSSLYPTESPLPGGGNAALGYVAEERGWYVVSADGEPGAYQLQVEGYRPGAETDRVQRQTVLLDFDGGRVNTAPWNGPGVRQLSPFSSFLPRWGIPERREAAMIRKVSREIRQTLVHEAGTDGPHRGVRLRVVNSLNHPEVRGKRNVSRIVIAGSVPESGIATVGVAETVDPGNFGHEDTALVLLDILSLPPITNISLNSFLTAQSDREAFVAQALGNITAHEIAHTVGNYHTENRSAVVGLMETGGEEVMPTFYGVGPDGIGGTTDDTDTHLETDQYARAEGFTGTEDTLNITGWAYPARP